MASGNWIGMDTNEVTALAGVFDAQATYITGTLIPTVTKKLASTTWQGTDRQKFEQQWNGQLISQLKVVAAALQAAASTAKKNVSAQTTTSNTL